MQIDTKYSIGDIVRNPRDSRENRIGGIKTITYEGNPMISYQITNFEDWIVEEQIELIRKGE